MEIIFKTKKPLAEYQKNGLILKKAVIKNNETGSEIIFNSNEPLNFEFSEDEILIEEQSEEKMIYFVFTVKKVEVTFKEENSEIFFLVFNENQIFQ